SLESFPWPPLTRIFSNLYTDGECFDLANLSKLSTHVRGGVIEFMKRADNRPGIDSVKLEKDYEGGLRIRIIFFPSNIIFHNLSNLESTRFKRYGSSLNPKLLVNLTGPEDVIAEQV
ncbi:hypothetical protein PMAYCL1PPCAC_27450, partial [Pristionchus mayeri]